MLQESIRRYAYSDTEGKVRKLINSLHVGILVFNSQEEVLFSNKFAHDMLGLSEKQLRMKGPYHPEWSVVYEDGSPFSCEMSPVLVALKTQKPVTNLIVGINRPLTGDRAWLLVNAEPILTDSGEVSEIVCSFSDITQRKAIEDKLTSLYQSLESRAFDLACSNADLERFVYVATHDLQEPLRLITSFLQLLKKKYDSQLDEQASEYINYAVDGSRRIKKLILDLLEYSKFSIDRDGFKLLDPGKVIEDVKHSLCSLLKQHHAIIDVKPLPVIYADPSLLHQLFKNLLTNSVKYRGESTPQISIDCITQGDDYLFSVSDNGIGIDPGYSEKIFDLFQRLHKNEAFEGTGVGLAICEKIIRLHRGSIWVESMPGKGSTFYFTIPQKQQW
ncbi:MAG TPA: ATP-binding protein [Chitinophagaceae bacterium]|nr:ATP-binding protein [Chitinophagaceae bacterium]HRF18397.1 ATP-binding protein [Chitinophagaceae bacterium]